MTSKHEKGFSRAFVSRFGEGESEEALAEVWRFVNLRSRSRGANRYKALALSLRLLPSHPGIGKARLLWTRTADALEAWLATEPAPTRATLESAISAYDSRQAGIAGKNSPSVGRDGSGRRKNYLAEILGFSLEADAAIAALPPSEAFENAASFVPRLAEKAELMVLTAAPEAVASGEWSRAGLLRHIGSVSGQERGPKAQALSMARADLVSKGASVEGARVLVVGDALGDLEAARANSAAFFPIVPGREEESWERFSSSGFEDFVAGKSGSGGGLLAAFLDALPLLPPWKKG